MAVNEITIVKAEVLEYQNQKIQIRLLWKVNGKYAAGYTGTYTAVLFEEEQFFLSQDFTDEMGIQDASVVFEKVKEDTNYTLLLKVPDAQGGAESLAAEIITGGFEITEGIYDGAEGMLKWKPQKKSEPAAGFYELTFSNGRTRKERFDPSGGVLHLDRNLLTPMGEEESVSVTLTQTDASAVSVGRSSASVRFNASGVRICSGGMNPVENGIEVSVTVQSSYEDLTEGKLSVLNNGTSLWEADGLTLEPVKSRAGVYSCKTVIPSETLDSFVLKRSSIRLRAKYGCAETAAAADADTLELKTPEITIREVLPGGWLCSVKIPKTGNDPQAFEVASERTSKTVGYADFLWETTKLCQPEELRVRAKYRIGGKEQTGPYSEKLCLPIPGYYPFRDENNCLKLQYCMMQEETGSNTVRLPAKLTGDLTETIDSAPIHLQKTDSGYLLKVQTGEPCSAKALEKFLLCLEEKAPANAVYTIRDMVLRLACISVKETPGLLCGWKEELRCAYLCPGIVLRVTTANYMRQTASEPSAAAGFVNAFEGYFPVTMNETDHCLVFDRFLNEMGKNMTVKASPKTDHGPKYISSLLELSTGTARQPYYCLLYPASLASAELPESTCASDHVILLASDSYRVLKTNLEMLEENPSLISSLQIPTFIILGRNLLSLCVQIWVEGKPRDVPIGSTLGDVIGLAGIHLAKKVRMYRTDALGEKREVFLNLAEGTENILLIGGDSIWMNGI